MFDLKKPCTDCPFKVENGQRFGLRPDRLSEIWDADAFQCHKTLENKPQQCAGLISVQHKAGVANTITRAAIGLASYDPALIDGLKTYGSVDEILEGHKGEIKDPCPDCGKELKDGPGGGVVCSCGYWFCY